MRLWSKPVPEAPRPAAAPPAAASPAPARTWREAAEELDRELEARRAAGEAISFAEFYGESVLREVEEGGAHPTLGRNLVNQGEWVEAGRSKVDRLIRLARLPVPGGRVVDYGCGSLRLGQHFIRSLDAGGYVGLDVMPGFFEIGAGLLGPELMAEKRPFLGVIGEPEAEERAAALGADLVLASAVAFHVHPDELGTFGRNLRRFAAKPGAVLLFDAAIAASEGRYAHRGWARRIEDYEALLAPLALRGRHQARPLQRDGREMTMELLEFRA